MKSFKKNVLRQTKQKLKETKAYAYEDCLNLHPDALVTHQPILHSDHAAIIRSQIRFWFPGP